ncbi:sonic hedgehog protein A-like, partial [Pollicipes pollicipes]|uniref:sonic hedgehog protein A-like n=1 Tax=Pollicipes pollicipes TaxID=41117 RepID=UPI00188509D2
LTWLLLADARACAPGRGHYRRRSPRKLTPLVYKQHVPNVSENTLGASGLPEGAITRQDPRFRELVPNYSEDVIFKDEEGTGADRLMTQRGKEKLNTLAISVMNQWPGVRLRVTEGWDESGLHAPQSLHYEGRAVDITTSDRDRSKYGMLARLAVEVGFDWVYFESRSHIHCSVKSVVTRGNGQGAAFRRQGAVLADGRRRRFTSCGDATVVKAVDESGAVVDSEVILWLDRDPTERRLFYRLTTASGRRLTVTPGHLLYVLDAASAAAGNVTALDARVTFVKHVIEGDYVLVGRPAGGAPAAERVAAVDLVTGRGVYAPLTRHGTVLASDVLASCYAMVDDQSTAHAAFLPVRWAVNVRDFVMHLLEQFGGGRAPRRALVAAVEPSSGVHWYASLLYALSDYVLPRDMMLD